MLQKTGRFYDRQIKETKEGAQLLSVGRLCKRGEQTVGWDALAFRRFRPTARTCFGQ